MNNDVPNQRLAGPDHSGRLHVQTHHEPETDSDTRTQMIKRPRHRKRSPTPSQWWLATRCFEPTVFLPLKSAIQDPRPVTVSILNRQRGRHMQGGWREA